MSARHSKGRERECTAQQGGADQDPVQQQQHPTLQSKTEQNVKDEQSESCHEPRRITTTSKVGSNQ